MSDGRTIGPPPPLDAAEQARRVADLLFANRSDSPLPPSSGNAGLSPLDELRQQALGRPSPWGGNSGSVNLPTIGVDRGPAAPSQGNDNGQWRVPPADNGQWRVPPADNGQRRVPPADNGQWRVPPVGTDNGPFRTPPAGTDRQPDRPSTPVINGVMKIAYGDPDFDAKLAQTNYSKVVISGVPKEFSPSPWIDDQASKGYFFWFKNPKNPDASDRTRHYFPENVKQIEIAQMQGNIYKPVLISADELRISASQAFMKQQNDSGYGSYRGTTDAFSYAITMSKVAGQALQYQEQLMREGAKNSPNNPYFHIYLADILTAEAVQPVIQAIQSGQTAYFDNPYTNGKLDEAIRESQTAGMITRQYGNLIKPPDHEMPLSPFTLNPNNYNPDAYWSGAAYQSVIRETQLSMLKQNAIMGKLPIELPPALPARH